MGDFDVFARRAELVLEATLSHGIEEALAAGVALSNNPFLGDNSLTALAGGAAVSPRIGLAYLDNAIGQLTGSPGTHPRHTSGRRSLGRGSGPASG